MVAIIPILAATIIVQAILGIVKDPGCATSGNDAEPVLVKKVNTCAGDYIAFTCGENQYTICDFKSASHTSSGNCHVFGVTREKEHGVIVYETGSKIAYFTPS